MKKTSVLFLLLSSVFLAAVYFAPLWHIRLEAPQYPDGLDMYIWINQITGTDDFTLQNVNILNHYIGMAAISPDSFVELNIMAYIVAALISMGLMVLAWRNRRALVVYTFILITAGVVGLTDFYLWLQRFGNNLDPKAPIIVPGMTYSPPFLGYKSLLNITASSFPHLGGYAFGLSVLFAALAVYFAFKDKLKRTKPHTTPAGTFTAIVTGLLLFSCKAEPQPIAYGSDNCEHCRMTISDQRYGAELVTKKGKAYKFDSAECLAAYVSEQPDIEAEMLLVTDFSRPGELTNAQAAIFLQSDNQPSPMGLNISAFASPTEVAQADPGKMGKLLRWVDVLKLAANQASHK
ncbi:MAG: hypothetical protein COW65_09315 [Cytophagales bacterium CG18_big_fil_WC_8_21_14_2_50_42_9]|nr:MAG: hypothetical protein COW65_09315 [Cytophagales bacterium CG18_big_fil_WC_8_21_14_2_50_42_9]